ncbi:MAG: outer membrane beta-barrel family protein [Muribaculaceae bacterium]|nr:outer membrane beta-barrel family protein [Muribaculaceae bacterium]
MKRILFLLFVNFLVAAATEAKEISGRVMAEQDTVPVEAARCVLMADGKQIACVETDDRGDFMLSTSHKGNLMLVIDKDNFIPTDVIVESTGNRVDLGDVWLSSGTMLDDLMVDGSITFDAKGRTIVYPSQADVKASPNSLSLFSKLPLSGLLADPVFRTISVLGDAPTILIDGVPSTQQDLLLIKPSNIEKIEYSILPPARYASGNGKGFISITLKKRNDGGDVYVWARAPFNAVMDDASLRVSYHQGPSAFTLSGSPSWRNYHKVYDTTEESYIGTDGFRLDQVSKDCNPFNYLMLPASLRYIYSPDLATLFTATLNMSLYKSHRRAYGETQEFMHNDYDFDNEQNNRDLSTSLDLYFRRDFNDRNSLEAQMVGSLMDNRYDRDNNYFYHDGRTETFPIDVKSNRRSLITAVSYVHNFSDYTSLTAGVKNILSHSRNLYADRDYEPTLTENNNYIYISASHLVDKVYLTARTGALLYWMRNDDNKRSYARNLTSLQMQWTPAQLFSLNVYADYSSGLPGLSSLTDYAQQITPYLISNGNPDLKGTHNISAYVGPTFRYKKLSVGMSVSYQKNLNRIYTAYSYIGDGMFLSRSENSRHDDTWSGGIQVQMSGLKGFGFNVSLAYDHTSTAGIDWNLTLASWSGWMDLWYNIGKFTVAYYRKFPGKYLSAQTIGKYENSDALSFIFTPDKHWDITASWMYMFDGHGTKYPMERISAVAPWKTDRFIRDNGNMIMLSVSYTADFGSVFRTKKRTLNNSDQGNSILKL